MSELEEILNEMRNGRFASRFHINPPATLEEIAYAEQELGKTLPSFYKEFLQLANGVYLDHGYGYFFTIYMPNRPLNQIIDAEHYALMTTHLSEQEIADMANSTDLLAQNRSRFWRDEYDLKHVRIGHSIMADILCREGDGRLFLHDHELYDFDDSWTITRLFRAVLDRLENMDAKKNQNSWWQQIATFLGSGK